MQRVTVQTFSEDGVKFLLMRVPCGRATCRKCPHGPYWYARFWSRGKMHERYIGKHLTAWADKAGGVSEERRAALREREALMEVEP